ncbi:MAG: VWA domain-containing protein [Minicystis sp.]
MSFAAPVLLAALALLVPVLLAFLVRRRRHVVRVPSTLLYRLAGATTAQNRRFKRIKHLASLLACLLAVAALVLAAARPQGGTRGETVAYVVDVSASMGAGGRDAPIEQARRFVARAVGRGGSGDRYAVIAAGATPVRLSGLSAPGPALDEAVARIAPQRGAADVDAALDLAASLVASTAGSRVVLISDGGESGAGQLAVREVPIARRNFAPAARDNVGIVAFATRPAPEAREDEREALITVATSSDRPRAARVTLRADDREIVDRRVEIPAHGDAEVRVRVLASIARLSAHVRPDDGIRDALAADDEATLGAAARAVPRVVLLAPAGDEAPPAAFFVEKALASAGARDVVHAPPDLKDVTLRPDDLVVVLGDGPPRRIEAPTLYLGTRSGVLPFSGWRELGSDATRLRSVEARDPLLRGVSLDGVTVEHAIAAVPPPGARALVDLDGGTVMIAGGAGRGAWVYLGIDPAKSDLVLRVAFPVLVANALHALGGAADVLVADTVARSEVTLRAATDEPLAAAEEPDAGLRLPWSPAVLLAVLGAALLALEAAAWRKGWAS